MTLGCRPNTSNDDSRRSIWRFLQAELPRAICQGRTHIIHAIFVGFQRWLDDKAARLSPGTRMEDGTNYLQRGLVAAYIADHLQPFLDSGRIRHIRARALSVEKDASFRITLADASTVKTDQPVIAASHPPP